MKQQLADTIMLVFPVLNAPTQLVIDASDTAVSAVIGQMGSDVTQPAAFFSKRFTSAQKKWSIFDRKLLAIFFAGSIIKYFLDGRSFTIFTDHKPLIFMFTSSMSSATARQSQHINYIWNFTSDIHYIQGEQNVKM